MLDRRVSAVTYLMLFFLMCARTGAQTSQPSDSLQPQTTWSGNEEGDPRIATRRGETVRFANVNILKRDGDRFTFEYWINATGTRHGLELEGQIRDGQIVAQATKILQGGVWDNNILQEIWKGALKDNTLTLQRTVTTNNAILTTTLTLDSGSARGGRRGGRRGRGAGTP